MPLINLTPTAWLPTACAQVSLLNQKIAQLGLVLPGITTVTAQNLDTPVVQTLLNSLSPITVDGAAIASGELLLALQQICVSSDLCLQEICSKSVFQKFQSLQVLLTDRARKAD